MNIQNCQSNLKNQPQQFNSTIEDVNEWETASTSASSSSFNGTGTFYCLFSLQIASLAECLII
ncbi:hypothetical protein BLOT_001097 [Blomia tropicalis]|nr:hypothetical protein BLOT_001097 [Blomia tropicalis]